MDLDILLRRREGIMGGGWCPGVVIGGCECHGKVCENQVPRNV